MAKSLLDNAFAHWHKPFDGFQTSAMEFYASVEAGLQRRELRDVWPSRVEFHEGGTLSSKREYLRITRQKLVFDLCAAPYGTGYFFSWWLGEKRPSRALCLFLLFVFIIAFAILLAMFGQAADRLWITTAHRRAPLIARFVLFLADLVAVSQIDRAVTKMFDMDPDDPILAVPLLGPLYEHFFRPMTYHRIDTMLMFQSMVKLTVEEAIDAATATKGIRALTEDEKKPIMRDFLRR